MGRPREYAPLVEVKPLKGAEHDLWQALGTFGSRLGVGLTEGTVVRIRDEWLRLDATALPVADRVKQLVRFAVDLGARQRDADRQIENVKRLVVDSSWAERRRRHEQQRRLLTGGLSA